MKTLTRNDYHLRFHGWDEGAGCRVWYFDGPVVIKVIEDSGKETTLDAFRRLDKLLEGNDWGYGEAPGSMCNDMEGPYRRSDEFTALDNPHARLADRDDVYS